MKQTNAINFISNYLLSFSALAFVLFFLILSYYNRPTYDDLGNIYYAKGKNIFEYVKLFYDQYGGRWTSWAYIYVAFAARENFQSIPVSVFIYYAITLFIFIYSAKEIIRIGAYNLFKVELDKKTTITFSILFIACFYFFTFNNIEAWWYICSSFHYLQGIVFLLLGMGILLKKNLKTTDHFLIAVSFIYVGSGYEMYALIVGSLLFSCIVYLHVKSKNTSFKGLTTAFVALMLSTVVSVIAPGNAERRSYFKENIAEYLHPVTFHDISGVLIQKKFLIAFIISAAWLIVGMKLKSNTAALLNKKYVKNIFILSISAIVLSVLIPYVFSTVFTYGIIPPTRAWTFTSFAFAFFTCFSFLIIGYNISFLNQSLQSLLALLVSACILLLLSNNLHNQYNYASNYSKKYDQLINSFLEAKKNKQTAPFYMENLPDSGMLMQLNMNDPTSNPIYLKKILGIDFEIIVKQ